MTTPLALHIDKTSAVPLTDQIQRGIAAAIEQDTLTAGMRLPSWIDLAAQLGVARGTVRIAYEKLAAAQLIEASRSAGTRVAERPPTARRSEATLDPGPFVAMYRELTAGPGLFQPGIPSRDSLPSKLMNRLRARALLAETSGAPLYPDPRGEPALRREIAGYLAVARGLVCSPDQVLVTAGYAAGLGLVLRALGLEGRRAWTEEPGFFFTRHALTLGRLDPVPVPVDEEGLDVDAGWALAPDAALAVVTPGQQAPLGVTMSLQRRLRLLDWASAAGAWIVEDDYLSELQLQGRAAPALASLDERGRVIHIGSFSKTIDPRLRLGFVVAPAAMTARFAEVAACLAPPPGPAAQLAIAAFMRDGHYLRHLRRTKRLYLAQRDALLARLRDLGLQTLPAALAVLVRTPEGASDVAIARELFAFGIAPAPLSVWYARAGSERSGLMLSVATAPTAHLARACDRLAEVLARA
ncbi:PLP-dependent aminotransferase family protein [Mitsuaria sp. GD03876]|nr:PLP-dependent aminotransferase family protein [Mitsuaria sp. GD03876]MDH0865837.1 PLP-dependent aminotransferase family protein [Mitsuaria sp. GD03876]